MNTTSRMSQADLFAVERNDGDGWRDAGFLWQIDKGEAQALRAACRSSHRSAIKWRVAAYTVCSLYRVR